MHDIDRTQLETSHELENYEYEQYENGETAWNAETGVFSEAQAMELAAELLEVSSEEELDRFLGNIIKNSAPAALQFARSPAGQKLISLLKGAVKKALPMVGSAVGGYFGGDSGANVGSQVASTAGRIFGLELEGLSLEDQEYEAAKSFVQFAGEAAKNAAAVPQGNSLEFERSARSAAMSALAAFQAAALKRAPGLVSGVPASTSGGATVPTSTCPSCGRGATSGRWMRRGNKIILFGA